MDTIEQQICDQLKETEPGHYSYARHLASIDASPQAAIAILKERIGPQNPGLLGRVLIVFDEVKNRGNSER